MILHEEMEGRIVFAMITQYITTVLLKRILAGRYVKGAPIIV